MGRKGKMLLMSLQYRFEQYGVYDLVGVTDEYFQSPVNINRTYGVHSPRFVIFY